MRFHEIQDALGKQPFEPFRIRLSTGQAYEVRHPEFAGLTRTSVFIGSSTDEDEIPNRMIQCDLLHIVAIEPADGLPKQD